MDEDGRVTVRQEVPQHDPPCVLAESLRCQNELPVSIDKDLGPHEARVLSPPGEAECQHASHQPTPHDRGDGERPDDLRQGEEEFGDPHQRLVGTATRIADAEPGQRAHREGKHDQGEGGHESRARSVDYPRPQITAVLVRSQGVSEARWLQALQEHDGVRVTPREELRSKGHGESDEDDGGRGHHG